jgi:single-strand DNA-binding protein
MLIGNLTRDPELKYTPNGAAVCTFGLATNSSWKGPDGNTQEITEYHNIVCWNKLAEICSQLLKVGSKVYVEGELRTRTWEDEKGKHYRTEIKISDMMLLANGTGRPMTSEPGAAAAVSTDDEAPVAPAAKGKKVEEEEEVDIDDLPF